MKKIRLGLMLELNRTAELNQSQVVDIDGLPKRTAENMRLRQRPTGACAGLLPTLLWPGRSLSSSNLDRAHPIDG